jgi:hypothetical protein
MRIINHKTTVALLLVAVLLAPAFAATIRQVGWEDLKAKVEFEDPFTALTQDQLYNLSIYARVTSLRDQSPDRVTDSMLKEAEEAEQMLREENVDIEGLLARREKIKALRAKRAHAMDQNLNGVTIRMPGYALPLEYDGEKVTEFLLVPWVGACIHTPPPPPNQIVHVKLDGGYEFDSRYQPVWVTGTVSVGAVSKKLYLVDGSSQINIGYSLQGANVETYEN